MSTSVETSVTIRMPTTILQPETTEVTNETMTSEIIMATSASELAPSQMTSQATTLGISGYTTTLMGSQATTLGISGYTTTPMGSQITTLSTFGDTNQSPFTTGVVMSSVSPTINENELQRSGVIGISIAGGFVGGIVVVLLLLLCCVPICFKVRQKKQNEYYVTSSKNCECLCGGSACMSVRGQVYCTSIVP